MIIFFIFIAILYAVAILHLNKVKKEERTDEETRDDLIVDLLEYYLKTGNYGYCKLALSCTYYTEEGKSCIAGRAMINPKAFEFDDINIQAILDKYGQTIFKPEYRGLLNQIQWTQLQGIHDLLATKNEIVSHNYDTLPISLQERITTLLKKYKVLVE